MASIFPTENTSESITLAAGEYTYIGRSIMLAVPTYGYYGISMAYDNSTAQIAGTVSAYDAIISFGANNYIEIEDTGSVWGRDVGIILGGALDHLVNRGTIAGYGVGIGLYQNGHTIENSGVIRSAGMTAYAFPFGGQEATISGSEAAIILTNSGTIENTGGGYAILCVASYGDTVTNTGKIIGAISLGASDDKLDTSKGTVKGTIDMGAGTDTVYGSAAADNIRGGTENDTVRGNGGNDKLYGDGGNDTIDGGTGNDTLEGGSNLDRLTGGTGNDQFRFTNSPSASHKDIITDFKHGQDKIALTASKFAALGSSVTSDEFGAKTSGHTAADKQHIIYDKSNGTLWYDADDNGSGAAVQFATLSNKPADLSYSDFLIV